MTRYAFNFTGRAIPGYDAPQCILLRPTARALLQAHAQLEAEGFAVQIYDSYRPTRVVKGIAAWAKAPDADGMKAVFFPGVEFGC